MTGVTVVGERQIEVDPDSYPAESFEETFYCASGDPIPGEWVGVPVADLLDDVAVPDETTHLRIQGRDGFTACLPIQDVVDGILAFDRRPLDDARTFPEAELPRFVAPDISGTRTVKSIVAVEAIQLDPGQDPESFEELLLEG